MGLDFIKQNVVLRYVVATFTGEIIMPTGQNSLCTTITSFIVEFRAYL